MADLLRILLQFLRAACRSRRELALEHLALRHQLVVLRRKHPRAVLKDRDRLFWIALSRLWGGWREALAMVKPETVVMWHRKGFRAYWGRNCGPGPGRPRIDRELRDLIHRMAEANPLWGAPKVHGELMKLGIEVSEATVSRYLKGRERRPTSQGWKTFIDNHARDLASVDFFAVSTVSFKVLFAFVVLSHDRRRILHFNVTEHPTASWAAQQLREAFPWGIVPKYLLRDGGGEFGFKYQQAVESLGMRDLVTSPGSPWQNGYVERVIGCIRRECLDHVITLTETHLRRILGRYVDYYNRARLHQGIGQDSPDGREVEGGHDGPVRAVPEVGGLHHRYTRKAA
jgi:putative transposase